MKDQKYSKILYFISFVVLLTVGVQGYWAYKTYKAEKQELLTDVQNSLDVAVDNYYTQLAQRHTIDFFGDSIWTAVDSNKLGSRRMFKSLDSLDLSGITQINVSDSSKFTKIAIISDTLYDRKLHSIQIDSAKSYEFIERAPFELLTSKIVVSLSQNMVSMPKLDSLFRQELDRRNLWITYSLDFVSPFTGWEKNKEVKKDTTAQFVTASSSYLMANGNKVEAYFSNTTPVIVQRNAMSLLLTIILVASIIGILFYMLRIIKQQKQLAEIKNDLISNITHEFKTPLATISVALEGIEQFNKNNDHEKTQKYAAMSAEQVKKLTHMVDKLLETASLDSQNLALNKQTIDLVATLTKLAAVPEAFIHAQKQILFTTQLESCPFEADRFHLENVIHTLIDNAFKYGGSKITLSLEKDNNNTILKIHDTGTLLNKAQAARIFDKFYRVPKGDHHDTKGFGIGLYYAKNIIEKHGGTISVGLKGGTTFTISLPNE